MKTNTGMIHSSIQQINIMWNFQMTVESSFKMECPGSSWTWEELLWFSYSWQDSSYNQYIAISYSYNLFPVRGSVLRTKESCPLEFLIFRCFTGFLLPMPLVFLWFLTDDLRFDFCWLQRCFQSWTDKIDCDYSTAKSEFI